MKGDFIKTYGDQTKINKLMQITYPSRRLLVNSKTLVIDILKEYPFLSQEKYVSMHLIIYYTLY